MCGGGEIEFVPEDFLIPGLTFLNVKNLLDQRKVGASKRAGWYFQQFLKMGYARVCKEESYVIWDADTIPLQKIDFFSLSGKPFLNLKEEYNKPYFDTIDRLLGMHKCIEKSFICENMLIKTNRMNEMLDKIEENPNISGMSFWEKIINAIDICALENSGFSEFETYGTYVMNNYPHEYELREFNSFRFGHALFGRNPSKEQLDWIGRKYSAIALERWDYTMPFTSRLLRVKAARSVSDIDTLVKRRQKWVNLYESKLGQIVINAVKEMYHLVIK